MMLLTMADALCLWIWCMLNMLKAGSVVDIDDADADADDDEAAAAEDEEDEDAVLEVVAVVLVLVAVVDDVDVVVVEVAAGWTADTAPNSFLKQMIWACRWS
mmetsp:Transcript_9555/g.15367  ORF Transcript_9555/g.15367 Transcript_9555/m.15367 type:complete len:102 (+) Transcript_9555:337-642(+)